MNLIYNKADIEKKTLLYEEVRDKIIADMLSLNLKPDEAYTTELKLAEKFQISRHTVRKAVDDLKDAGYLTRRRNVGLIVTKKACSKEKIINSFSSPKFVTNNTGSEQLVMVLPHWNIVAEGFITNILLKELRNNSHGEKKLNIEVRFSDDPLDDLNDNISTLIIIDPQYKQIPTLESLTDSGIRVIGIETSDNFHMCININFRKKEGCIESVKKLYALGHRKIGFLNQNLGHQNYRNWLKGYLDVHRELDLKIDPMILHYNKLNASLKLGYIKRASAWLCTNAANVNFLSEALHYAGLKVPKDVSVIGTDDPGDVLVAQLGCKLTVMRSRFSRGAKIIRQIIEGKINVKPGDEILAPVEYIERESVSRLSP